MTPALKLFVLIGLSCGLLIRADAHCKKNKGCCQSCGKGWMQLNGRCFRFVNKLMDWCDAEKHCVGKGGNLASIHSKEDYDDLRELIKDNAGSNLETWIGGTDSVKEKCWLYSDGTPFDYHKIWGPGEPNNFGKGEHCLELNYKGKDWGNDWDCATKRPFICGKDMEDIEPDVPN